MGVPVADDFSITTDEVPDPGPREFVVRVTMLSLDPAMRGWMDDRPSYLPPIGIDEVIRAGAVGEVVASNNARFPVGTLVSGTFGVQEYAVSDGSGVTKVDTALGTPSMYLGVLGMTGMTAYFGLFEHGRPRAGDTVLVSAAVTTPHLLVGVVAEVVDGTDTSISRRFSYAFVDEDGTVTEAGPAPYLDAVAAPPGSITDHARRLPWLASGEEKAVSWLIENRLPGFLAEVQPRRQAELAKVRRQVTDRLTSERDRLYVEATVAGEQERNGQKPKESSDSLTRKADELDARLARRLRRLSQQEQLATRPPRILGAAVLLPLSDVVDEVPQDEPLRHAVETKVVERRGVDAVLAHEHRLGRRPVEQAHSNPGYDILSLLPDGSTLRIEVKARIEGSDDFFISHNEVLTGKNAAPRYRLALVRVDQRGPGFDQVRYLDDPFATTTFGDFDATGLRGDWAKMWARGTEPF